MKRVLLLAISIVSLGLIIAKTVHAQTPPALNLTVTPAVIDLTANPGDTMHEKFRIRNNTDHMVPLSIEVAKLSPRGDQGEVVPLTPTAQDTYIQWMTFDQTTLTALSNEWTDVSFTLTVPKDAAFGYYYAIRISENTATGAATTNGAKVLGEVVVPVLLTVKSPNAKQSLELISFKPETQVSQYLPVKFLITVKNTGNIHIRPQGNVFIQLGNKDTAILSANPSLGAILPGATRTFETSWDEGFLVEQPVMQDGEIKRDTKGNPMTQLAVNWDKLTEFRIGKYSATALLVYDNGSRDVPLNATTTFWVFPYTIVGMTILAILIIVFGLRFILRSYIAREVKKSRS